LRAKFYCSPIIATVALVDGPVVYDSLQSIPIDQERPILLSSLWCHSRIPIDTGISEEPQPPGYLYPGVDLLQSLRDIASAVAAGKYTGEYDFQTDLQALFVAARDGHLSYRADLTGIAAFKVPNAQLASYSPDGVELPPSSVSDLLALIGFRNTSIGVPYTPSASMESK